MIGSDLHSEIPCAGTWSLDCLPTFYRVSEEINEDVESRLCRRLTCLIRHEVPRTEGAFDFFIPTHFLFLVTGPAEGSEDELQRAETSDQ